MTIIEQAWQAFVEGKLVEAKDLLSKLNEDTASSRSLRAYLALEEQHYQQAMKLYEQNRIEALLAKNQEELHVALHQQAMVAREMDRLEEALDLIAQEAEIIRQHFSDDALRLAVNAYEQGYLRLKLHQTSEGLVYMKKSLSWALETDDLIAQACAYRGLGELYQELGASEESHLSFEQSLSLFCQAGDHLGAEEIEKMLKNSEF
ncbi:hypothetical protein [Streptococcus himalayensis]|uniref:Tetratricopeptide repeat protein n=1 Tax=Streptococcus himalayensis TaxID=1888195 RepID=A0A917A9B8_9STRE|nr:hypothetical protein [Streptococcus himalayensis]GGE36385.1 hypothetical protein GCM10011510_17180 [Streptococcus himalayensis]